MKHVNDQGGYGISLWLRTRVRFRIICSSNRYEWKGICVRRRGLKQTHLFRRSYSCTSSETPPMTSQWGHEDGGSGDVGLGPPLAAPCCGEADTIIKNKCSYTILLYLVFILCKVAETGKSWWLTRIIVWSEWWWTNSLSADLKFIMEDLHRGVVAGEFTPYLSE